MIRKNILVLGGSGQIGRHLIRRLTQNNHIVTVITRNIHQKGYILKTQGNPGYINIVEAIVFDEEKLSEVLEGKNICINLIGILNEKNKNDFQKIHNYFPDILSKIAKSKNIEQFIHISALAVDQIKDSKYAASKLLGEKAIIKNFKEALILRPSLVYSSDDNFTTKFMTLLSVLPFFPLYYNGQTRFAPIHCLDLCEIILSLIEKKLKSEIIECVGPEEISLKEIIEILLKSLNKKRLLIPIPYTFAKIMARIFQLLPNPPMTVDQLNLLKYDSLSSGNFKSNFDLNLNSKRYFGPEVEKYSYMWKEGGEYSKKPEDDFK